MNAEKPTEAQMRKEYDEWALKQTGSVTVDFIRSLPAGGSCAPLSGYAAKVVRKLRLLENEAEGPEPLTTNIQQILRQAQLEIEEEFERTQPHTHKL